MQGVLIAQLFQLQLLLESPSTRLSFAAIGVPLSIICYCAAILIAATGAYRFWKQQNAMLRGRIYAGGWELTCIAAAMFVISCIYLVACLVP